MAYKERFRPSEILTGGAWRPLDAGMPSLTAQAMVRALP